MKASLQVDGKQTPMKPFVESYLANICDAMLRSLKGTQDAGRAVFQIEGKKLELRLDDRLADLHMDKGFAAVIVRDTLLGVLAHLRGVRGWTEIRVQFDR
jgi:hypothetical protein